jgi:hypothetical protein
VKNLEDFAVRGRYFGKIDFLNIRHKPILSFLIEEEDEVDGQILRGIIADFQSSMSQRILGRY